MKKIVLAFLLLLCLFINVLASNYPSGDINGDGKVGSTDYILVRKHILGTSKLTGDKLTRADVNSDGVINIQDYINVRKIIDYLRSTQFVCLFYSTNFIPYSFYL